MREREDENEHGEPRSAGTGNAPLSERDALLLQRYVDGELRPTEKLEFEERLCAEPPLDAALLELEDTRDYLLMGKVDPAPLGLGFADRLWQSYRKDYRKELHAGHAAAAASPQLSSDGVVHTLKFWTALAASILVLLSALALFFHPSEERGLLCADDRPETIRQVLRRLDQTLSADARTRGDPPDRRRAWRE